MPIGHRPQIWPRTLRMLCLWACVGSMAACFPGQPKCNLAALDVKYTYSTTCSGIAAEKSGAMRLTITAGVATQQSAEKSLASQLSTAGFRVEELVMRWPTISCTEAPDAPREATSIDRMVLEPDADTISGVAVLLVCRPTNKEATTLKRDLLLACSRGNQPSVACTIQLKQAP